jgi:multiple sugar transport system ATP-binding protein
MNFVTAQLVRDDGPAVTFAGYKLPVPESVLEGKPGLDEYFGREVIIGIRPSDFEDAKLAEPGYAWAKMQVTVGVTEELGSEVHAIFTIDAPQVEHSSITDAARGEEGEDEAAVALAGGKSLWTARVTARSSVRPGSPIELAVDTGNMHFFDPVSGLSIGHPGADETVADVRGQAG